MKYLRNILAGLIIIIPVIYGINGLPFIVKYEQYDIQSILFIILPIVLPIIAFYYVLKNYRWSVWLTFMIGVCVCIPCVFITTGSNVMLQSSILIFELIASAMLLHVDTTLRKSTQAPAHTSSPGHA